MLILISLNVLSLSYFYNFYLVNNKMPRGGGSRGGSRGSSSSPSRSSFAATRPQQQQAPVQQPQTAQKSGGMFSGFGSTLMQGMAFGAGSEVAHQAVRSVIGGGSHSNQQVAQQPQQQQQVNNQTGVCQTEILNFSQCIERNSDLSYCQSFADMLKSCKQSNGIL